MTTEYDTMFQKFLKGEISEQTWREFANRVFVKVLEKNRDVFVRLKHR